MRVRLALLSLALAAGCALYSEVVVGPLFLDVRRAAQRLTSSPKELFERGEYSRVIELTRGVESRPNVAAKDLAMLGAAELAAGRLDDARRHLRRALDLRPIRTEIAQIAWDLSQLEYLANNFAASLEWAMLAERNGLQIRQWHMDYLTALSNIDTYQIEDERSARVRMAVKNPRIPRIDVNISGHEATGVIDSGAVLSIISQTLAQGLQLKRQLKRLGTFTGAFYGLLGEPISVSFGLLDAIRIGNMTIRNVPVAIMPDEKLNFVVLNREPLRMEFLLGANLLKEFRLEFDYSSSYVTFEALGPGDRIVADNQNLFFVGFRPFVHTAINKRAWYPFVLDTGSEITFLNAERVDSTPLVSLPRFHGATLQGLGGARKVGSKMQDVELGVDRWAGRFRDIPLYSTEQSPAYGIVGQDFLKNFRVVVDFGAMRVDLHRERNPFRTTGP